MNRTTHKEDVKKRALKYGNVALLAIAASVLFLIISFIVDAYSDWLELLLIASMAFALAGSFIGFYASLQQVSPQ